MEVIGHDRKYGSTYSDYILLEVHRGIVTGEMRLNGSEYTLFKERQFQAFKKTPDHRRLFNYLMKYPHPMRGRLQQSSKTSSGHISWATPRSS